MKDQNLQIKEEKKQKDGSTQKPERGTVGTTSDIDQLFPKLFTSTGTNLSLLETRLRQNVIFQPCVQNQVKVSEGLIDKTIIAVTAFFDAENKTSKQLLMNVKLIQDDRDDKAVISF